MKFRREYPFKIWINLEYYKEKMLESVQNSSPDFPQYVLEYISLATKVPYKWYENANWVKIITLFYICISKSPTIKLPIISPTNEKHTEEPWNYPQRSWYLYAHIIAKSYGWSLDKIAKLKVKDALSLIQEIMTDTQLDREFQYGLSEVAYPYNEQTKKSIFKPLERPHWMRPDIKPIAKFKIPVSMLPMGEIKIDGVLPDEYLPKEIH